MNSSKIAVTQDSELPPVQAGTNDIKRNHGYQLYYTQVLPKGCTVSFFFYHLAACNGSWSPCQVHKIPDICFYWLRYKCQTFLKHNISTLSKEWKLTCSDTYYWVTDLTACHTSSAYNAYHIFRSVDPKAQRLTEGVRGRVKNCDRLLLVWSTHPSTYISATFHSNLTQAQED